MAGNARQKMRELESRYSATANGGPNSGYRLSTSGQEMNKIRVNRPSYVRQESARPGMAKAASVRPGGIQRQASARPGMTKAASAPIIAKNKSKKDLKKEKSKKKLGKEKSKKALKKEKSKKKLEKAKSKKALQKEKSKKKMEKEASKANLQRTPLQATLERSPSRGNLQRTPSRGNLQRTPSRGNLQRTPSRSDLLRTSSRGSLQRTPSRSDLRRQGSQQSFKSRPKLGERTLSMESVQFQEFQRRKRRWERFKKMERRPRKSLVIIWLVVLAELSFDLGTTIIAFRAMFQEEHACCGKPLNLGPLPLSVATPFIFLIVLELLILVRAVVLTIWPSILDHQKQTHNEDGTRQKGLFRLCFCNCFKWSVKSLLRAINVLVLLNPFFGCIIAWMLLYQSDKDESFLVLGLEGSSIILHFISIKLEGSVNNWKQFLFHCMPLIPFLASVSLVLFYLKQEGVCYVVAQAVFQFQGCEICPNGFPPINGNCILENGTVVAIDSGGLFDDSLLDNPGDITKASAAQGTFCGMKYDGWDNNTAFCFFGYEGDD